MRGAAKLVWSLALPGLVLCCSEDKNPTPTPPGAPPKELVIAGAPVMIGAGDIAVCGTSGDEATGSILDSVLAADSRTNVHTAVFTLSANAHPDGSAVRDND